MQEKTPPRSPRLIEARFQNRTDRNRVPDSNRSSKAVPGQEESGGFRHGQLGKVSRRKKIWCMGRGGAGMKRAVLGQE